MSKYVRPTGPQTTEWYAGECLDCGVTMVKRYVHMSDMNGKKHVGYGGRCTTCTPRYARKKKDEDLKRSGAIEVLEVLTKFPRVTKREIEYMLKKYKEESK